MNLNPKYETLTIITQNIIPKLTEIPYDNVVQLTTMNASCTLGVDYDVSGKTVTFYPLIANYDLLVGDTITVYYLYNNEEIYDPSSPSVNPSNVTYNIEIVEENIVPKLIHRPVTDTLYVLRNGNVVIEEVDWEIEGKVLTWVSLTTLEVGDILTVDYRRTI